MRWLGVTGIALAMGCESEASLENRQCPWRNDGHACGDLANLCIDIALLPDGSLTIADCNENVVVVAR